MAILVTGGAGYIGSVMVERLVRGGLPTVVADNMSRGHPEAVPDGVPVRIGSVTDERFVEEVFASDPIEAVLHFAASSLVGESMQDPGAYFANNVGGVLTLLRVMSRRGVSRFVLSSTAATYGDPGVVPIPEDAPSAPTNPYGESKRICESLLRWFGEIQGIRWTALRYFNAAGASEERGEAHAVETHLIPLALRAAAGRSGELSVFGLDYPTPDGSCIRDYVHVEDLADAHLLALRKLETEPSGIYNLGNGQGFSVLEVLSAVEKVTGRAVPWKEAPRRPGDPPRLVASSARARSELGWRPRKADLETIVGDAWRWDQSHPDGYPSARDRTP